MGLVQLNSVGGLQEGDRHHFDCLRMSNAMGNVCK